MPKLKLPDIEKVVAIDIHTHAEEPCGMHGDDGYDDFQVRMADYFKSPHKHPPTVPETAAYYRSKNIAAVIFPVDAERETGFRRYNNYEMLEVAAENSVERPFALARRSSGDGGGVIACCRSPLQLRFRRIARRKRTCCFHSQSGL